MTPVRILSALAATALVAGPAIAGDDASEGQAKLAKLLEGRVAGEPQSCVHTLPNTHMQVIDGTAIVVDRGSTIYVNVPRDPAALDEDDAMEIRKTGSQLCRTDLITTFDRTGGFYTGNIFLGDFVPYRKADS